MATVIRSPSYTPAWTCVSSSKADARLRAVAAVAASARTRPESRAVRRVPYSRDAPWVAGDAPRARRQSDRIHHALDRLVDPVFPDAYAAGDTAAASHGMELAVAFAPHARALCVLLRVPAFHHLHLAGSALRFTRHHQGHRQAPVHHDWICRICAADTARGHLDQRNGAQAREQALAGAASTGLCHRHPRRDPLLVAGKKR